MYEVYTPGHGLVTDSLIMHGIVRLYDVSEVERVGDRYRIVLNSSKPKKPVLSLLREELDIYFNNKEAISNSSILGKIMDANVNVAVTTNWMSYLQDAIDKANFDNLASTYTPDHKKRTREGRSKSKSLYTLYLPLSFIYGKFSQSDYLVGEMEYRVCDTCFALANVGLIYGTAVIRYAKGDTTSVTLLSVIPGTKMTRTDLLLAQRFVRGKSLTLETELTMKATLLYALSIGETLFSFRKGDYRPQVLIWRIEKVGNFMRSTEPMAFELEDLLEKIGKIKAKYPMLAKLVKELAKADERAPILDRLAEVILLGYNAHSVIKEFVPLTGEEDKKSKKRKKLPREVIKGLGDLASVLISVQDS